MAQKRDGPNWRKIKAEYVRGGISQQKLADKYGVSISTIERRARLEKWTELRKAREGKVAEKLVEKTADIQADTAARLMQMQSEATLAIYKTLLNNIKAYPNGVGTKTLRETVEVKKIKVNGEEREFPLKSSFVADLEAIVRSMASLARLYGVDVASQQSRERFELQKQQNGSADDTESFNANMISIAELINHPMPDRAMTDVEAPEEEAQEADGDLDG
mgnify:CR=1 FL=1